MSLPGRASDQQSGLEGKPPEMSSAGADGRLAPRRNGAGQHIRTRRRGETEAG